MCRWDVFPPHTFEQYIDALSKRNGVTDVPKKKELEQAKPSRLSERTTPVIPFVGARIAEVEAKRKVQKNLSPQRLPLGPCLVGGWVEKTWFQRHSNGSGDKRTFPTAKVSARSTQGRHFL